MKKFLDGIICTLFETYLTFAWVRYFTKNNTAALCGALCVGAATAYICYYVGKRGGKKQAKNAENKKKSALLADKLRYNADNAELFLPLLAYFGYSATKLDQDSIVAERDGTKRYVALCYADPPTDGQIAKQIVRAKRAQCDNLLLFCTATNGTQQATAKAHFDVTFVDIAAAYALFETANKLPSLPNAKPTRKLNPVASYALSCKRFGWYMFGALFTAATGLVGYLRFYSLFWATILFGLALFCLFNKRYNITSTPIPQL